MMKVGEGAEMAGSNGETNTLEEVTQVMDMTGKLKKERLLRLLKDIPALRPAMQGEVTVGKKIIKGEIVIIMIRSITVLLQLVTEKTEGAEPREMRKEACCLKGGIITAKVKVRKDGVRRKSLEWEEKVRWMGITVGEARPLGEGTKSLMSEGLV